MNILIGLALTIYVIVTLLMIVVILMQRPKSEGLGAAFGGGMTDNLFGAQTTNVLAKFTTWLAGIFFALTFLLSILYSHRTRVDSSLRQNLMQSEANAPAPAVTASPAVAAQAAPPGPDTAPVAEAARSPMPADLAAGAVVPPAAQAPLEPKSSPAASPQPRQSP